MTLYHCRASGRDGIKVYKPNRSRYSNTYRPRPNSKNTRTDYNLIAKMYNKGYEDYDDFYLS
jgi:hypothetical protein